VRTDGDHTVTQVEAQMTFLRGIRGTGQHAQLIGGEVSLLDTDDHARTLQVMLRHGCKPMSMTHGDFDESYLHRLALDAPRRHFVEMFERLQAEHGVGFDLAHNMTVTPANLAEVAEVTRNVMSCATGWRPFSRRRMSAIPSAGARTTATHATCGPATASSQRSAGWTSSGRSSHVRWRCCASPHAIRPSCRGRWAGR